MKKLLSILLVLAMVFSMAACGSKEEPAPEPSGDGELPETDKLVIYTCFTEPQMEVIEKFKEATGIDVEVITGGGMEMLQRAEAEKDNPYADIVIGGSKTSYMDYLDMFQEYVTPNNEFLDENHKVEYNKLTPYTGDCILIIKNTDLIGDIPVTGWGSLINPELKGKIAMADPSSASSAFSGLAIMAWTMGDGTSYFSDQSKEFLTKFIENLDGKLASGSSACHKSCADGEYAVAVTFNSAAYTYVAEGAPIEVVFPEEGTSTFSDVGGIIDGCANLANARKFMDYVTDIEAQTILGAKCMSIPVRPDAELPDFMVAPDQIPFSGEDALERAASKSGLLDMWTDILTSF